MILNGWRLKMRNVDGESKRLGKHDGIYVRRMSVVISSVASALLRLDINRRLDFFLHSGLRLVQPSQIPPIVYLTSVTSPRQRRRENLSRSH